ncbi:MAG: Gfo/Idh/MocA family oxidoreductase [Phycisphaerae bacterium]|nr:Gfo/Idh/MocA family oxidoreductase [Phycisphaerae bacterium]
MRRAREMTRRQLLRNGATWAAGAAAAPYVITSTALGAADKPAASNRITMGFIGVNWMGGYHLNTLLNNPRVQVRAISDVDQGHLDRAVEKAGPDCRGYHDYRDLLARPDIDAVLIATPDHWHALTAIHACEAGKDVYCEKPLSLTVREARRMVEAARRNGTVFQVGSQQRSADNFRLACELVRSGRIGKVFWARAVIGGAPTIEPQPTQPVPPALDWDRWLGPAPWSDYTEKRCHVEFRWLYDYSGGKMTDWGAHHNDITQWGFGTDDTGPVKIEPVSATFPTAGLWDAATAFEVKNTYADGRVLYTCSSGKNRGVWFQGTDGWVEVDRGYLRTSNPDMEKEPLGAGDMHLERTNGDDYIGHHDNWLNCIETRRRPICDVEIGARSAMICHLGNIAIRTGKTIHWDPEREVITNDVSLNRWLDKPYRAPWRV